ncbi:MAG: UPF0182 family protein [Caldilineaceae bacterium]|nr:UPF0182 family protein [Caldilineaceae bacterium]
MKERDPFRELIESLNEEDWKSIENELLDRDGGNGGPGDGGRRPGGGGGGNPEMPEGNLRMIWWIAIPFLLLTFFNRGLSFYTNWLWYESMEFASVFMTRITASVGLLVAGALIFWIFLAVNVLLARRLEPHGLDNTPISQIASAIGVRITPVILLVGAVFAFFMGSGLSTTWEQLLLYFNQTDFNIVDPVFGNDVSFYVFTLPIWQIARNWMMTTLVLTLIATALVSGIGWRGWYASAPVRAHLSALGAMILLLIAWQYRLDAYQLLYSVRGATFGASYTDVNAQLPAYNLLLIITVIAAVLLLINVFLRQTWRIILGVLAAWFVIAVVAGSIYPGLIQQFQVDPNEFTLERPFIEDNIRLTRIAYDLDNVEVVNYRAVDRIPTQTLIDDPNTILNLRLWDYRPLFLTYNQIQALRQYYVFNDIDVDRYMINGQVRQVMLSARELYPEGLTEEAQTWVNRRLVYTHGYGVAMSPVAEITPDGLPRFLLRDLPPTGVLENTVPQIYFGERTNDYVIVRTQVPEFDYPAGDGNVFTTFSADTGIPIGNFLTRLVFALRFGDINIILADAITPESRLLWQRNIAQRAQTVAPFLQFDADPYIVLGADGKLYWFQDAYTTSSLFPYSTPLDGRNALLPRWNLNYIRNSVKVITDAYTGEMTFYIVDSDEPLIAAYNQIFPALFTPISEMPDFLLRHIRYPTGIFSVQAEMYRTYHMTDPGELYNREDLWAWPTEIFDNNTVLMEPYYVLMELPGESDGLDFVQILPFTPSNRENMIAWLAVKSNPERYGRQIAYQFGKDTLYFGPKQVESRIDQDPIISAQLALWNQQGTQVIRGNLLVFPIGGGLLYVEPLYLQAATGRIPELKRVIVATADQVVMEENLGLGLARIFGQQIAEADVFTPLFFDRIGIPTVAGVPQLDAGLGTDALGMATLEQLIVQANSRYTQAQDALRSGNWAEYGIQIQALEQVLQQLAQVTGAPVPTIDESPAELEGEPIPVEPAADTGS